MYAVLLAFKARTRSRASINRQSLNILTKWGQHLSTRFVAYCNYVYSSYRRLVYQVSLKTQSLEVSYIWRYWSWIYLFNGEGIQMINEGVPKIWDRYVYMTTLPTNLQTPTHTHTPTNNYSPLPHKCKHTTCPRKRGPEKLLTNMVLYNKML